MEQGVNLLANFPLSSPFFFLTTELRGRPRKHINFAAKPVLKIIVYGNGLTQGPAHMEAPSNGLLVNPCWHNHIKYASFILPFTVFIRPTLYLLFKYNNSNHFTLNQLNIIVCNFLCGLPHCLLNVTKTLR